MKPNNTGKECGCKNLQNGSIIELDFSNKCKICSKQYLENIPTKPNAMTGVEEWETKIDEELYFLHQDGYGGDWVMSKKKYIKDIIRTLLTAERERAAKLVEKARLYPITGLRTGRVLRIGRERVNDTLDIVASRIRKGSLPN